MVLQSWRMLRRSWGSVLERFKFCPGILGHKFESIFVMDQSSDIVHVILINRISGISLFQHLIYNVFKNPLWLCSSSQKSESERNTENGRGRKQKSRITEKAYWWTGKICQCHSSDSDFWLLLQSHKGFRSAKSVSLKQKAPPGAIDCRRPFCISFLNSLYIQCISPEITCESA